MINSYHYKNQLRIYIANITFYKFVGVERSKRSLYNMQFFNYETLNSLNLNIKQENFLRNYS